MNNTRAAGPVLPVFLILLAILLQCQSVLAEDQVKDSYVGEKVCASCHKEQSQQWKGSHHDMAMMTASETSVLGDFTNGSLTHDGVTSKFFKRGDDFFVNTIGPDGKPHDYNIKYTFGVYPLQQYLIEFPGGRLQALDVSWDSRPKEQGGQRWFRLNPDEKIPPGDVLHWTGPNLNWNYMCAECHSTNLMKNYDSASNSYDTSWSEINVSCEACHGPGESHVSWANSKDKSANNMGLTTNFNERKGVSWSINSETGQPVRSEPLKSNREIEACAVCHSRRSQIGENDKPGEKFNDSFQPSLLTERLYHADGQIDDEVYVYGSFLQSKMYQAGVTCSDCHNPHLADLHAPGEQVCYSCHRADVYTSSSHHHHEKGTTGASCVECHMPPKTYMEVDARHDHGFRIPRPDLSVKLGTPNACNNCHDQQTPLWASEKIESWYGRQAEGYQQFATALHSARNQLSASQSLITSLAANTEQPMIAQATAVSYLGQYRTPAAAGAIQQALQSTDPMLKLAALDALDSFDIRQRVQLAFPLLDDETRSVRINAARLLASVPVGNLPEQQKMTLDTAIGEFINAQLFNAERPESQVNLGGIYSDLGRNAEAESAYRKAIELQKQFVPAYVNLAQLLSEQNKEGEAIDILQSGLQQVPDDASLHHVLGLALVRQKDLPKALEQLSRAAELAPDDVRFSYVYAIALQSTGEVDKALEVLETSYGLHPGNPDVLFALVTVNRDAGNKQAALRYLAALIKLMPENMAIRQLQQELKR
jgi:tetratricopeptide (TPR) repeat protein